MSSPEQLSRRALLGGLAAGLCLPVVAGAAPPSGGPQALGGLLDEAPHAVRLRNANLVLPDGRVHRGGLVVEDGRITAVGPHCEEGEDLGGDWLFPGVFDAGCSVGMVGIDQDSASRDDRDSGALTADARAIDGYNPLSDVIPVTRRGGVTGVLALPQGGGLVAGQAAAMQTAGRSLVEAQLKAPAALLIRLGQGGAGGSRVSALRELRAALEKAPAPPTVPPPPSRRAPFPGGPPGPPPPPEDRLLGAARARQIKVLIAAERADDIERALGLCAEWGLDAALIGGAEAHLLAKALADAAMPVILSPVLAQPDGWQRLHARYDNAARLHAAGVQLAFASGAAHFSRNLRVDVGVLTAHGLPAPAARHALCAGGPEVLGLPGLGRLEPGAVATFVRASGDPLQPRSAVKAVWYGGRRASMSSVQTRLFDEYRELSPLRAPTR
jgi:imidazolonepropionase-like amidohydrolase